MSLKRLASNAFHSLRVALAWVALFQFTLGASLASAAPPQPGSNDANTTTPIKHVIIIIGENRTFDHVFATYVPQPGQHVLNLLSEGIIALDANKNAVPGPNWALGHQLSASSPNTFLLAPPTGDFPNDELPTPLAGGPSGADGYFSGANPCGTPAPAPPLPALACAMVSENGLPNDYYQYLISGGTGLKSHTPDTRITNVSTLPAGPFQLTNSNANGFNYNAYAASPVHRFYQMWQQEDCNVSQANPNNPSGCDHNLFAWVEVTIGAGSDSVTSGAPQPPLCNLTGDVTPCFTTNFLPNAPTATTTGEGSTALGFYNMQQGDAPYFKMLADTYAMSDNFHQSVDGGTGANHIMLGHGDAIYFYDPTQANPFLPPSKVEVYQFDNEGNPNPDVGVVQEIENPNPAAGTNNWYKWDGYGVTGNAGYPPPYSASPVSGGGSYSNCSDPKQAGVGPIWWYLITVGNNAGTHCEEGRYYLLNNYNPGWFGNGKNAYTDTNPANTPFTIPPNAKTPSIGDDLNAHNISWKYYGDQWNNYVPDPYQINYGTNGPNADEYCNICNPFQYDSSIMGNPAQIAAHIQDTLNLYSDIANGTLPAVSFVKPSGYVDGHPASSKLNLFEGFTKKIVDLVQGSFYASNTAIFITFDEGGGYYDSGYVQPLDFFGDGTRIPLIVVSAYSKGGHINHAYGDHVSLLKFIERNWSIPPVSNRSRDNYDDPVPSPGSVYVPTNGPALTDLFGLFSF